MVVVVDDDDIRSEATRDGKSGSHVFWTGAGRSAGWKVFPQAVNGFGWSRIVSNGTLRCAAQPRSHSSATRSPCALRCLCAECGESTSSRACWNRVPRFCVPREFHLRRCANVAVVSRAASVFRMSVCLDTDISPVRDCSSDLFSCCDRRLAHLVLVSLHQDRPI